MKKRMLLTTPDVMRLRGLIRNPRSAPVVDRETLLDLQAELERAFIVEADQFPDDIVALDSRVLVRDLATNRCTVYTPVYPAQADPASGCVSVLAPLGTALLGYRKGDEVEWWMPGGLRRLKIEAVM